MRASNENRLPVKSARTSMQERQFEKSFLNPPDSSLTDWDPDSPGMTLAAYKEKAYIEAFARPLQNR